MTRSRELFRKMHRMEKYVRIFLEDEGTEIKRFSHKYKSLYILVGSKM
jgi:hypothetical protein